MALLLLSILLCICACCSLFIRSILLDYEPNTSGLFQLHINVHFVELNRCDLLHRFGKYEIYLAIFC